MAGTARLAKKAFHTLPVLKAFLLGYGSPGRAVRTRPGLSYLLRSVE